MPAQRAKRPIKITNAQARHIWLDAQKIHHNAPFGQGAPAVHKAIAQLGYVQIDTINVVERCHHHILFNRIPNYRTSHLTAAQSDDKSVFEYWTHALAYLPIEAYPHFVSTMKNHAKNPTGWGGEVSSDRLRKILKRIKNDGPLAIANIKDDKLTEKSHLWASKKPSKVALEAGFYAGKLAISRRKGMEKFYELTNRHFGWDKPPRPSTQRQRRAYQLDRALTAQGFVSLNSICHLNAPAKPEIQAIIAQRLRTKKLVELEVEGATDTQFFMGSDQLEQALQADKLMQFDQSTAQILSPFDPLMILRNRTRQIFQYDHLFEAYVTEKKRKLGYFTLPVLIGDKIVAGLDLKTDRLAQKMIIKNWVWFDETNKKDHTVQIETALEDFENFQLDRPTN